MKEIIFIGVSWPYGNGKLHIGHLAGQNIVCDVFARYHRQKRNDVLMVSGTDAHGTPITVKAEKEGIPPEELAEKYRKTQLKTFKNLDIEWDNFTTTESENHKKVAQNIFRVLYENGDIYPKEIEQYYDSKAKKFLSDRYIEGTCPYCGNKEARGDQCDSGCGRTLDPSELIDPKSKLTGEVPKLKKHTILFFNLPAFESDIKKLVENSKGTWRERVVGFAEGWLKDGLQERAISRELGYGIPIPIEEFKDQDIYVWFEAVMGYLSASVEWARSKEGRDWEYFWKNPKAKHYYFIAKDNIPFHTILWPATIMAYNKKYNLGKNNPALDGEKNDLPLNLPYDIPANQFLTEKGRKISKSKGTLLEADELIELYGKDLVRYFFCKYAPENHDREFTHNDIIDLNNNELVATFGNFVNRGLTFIYSKLGGELKDTKISTAVLNKIDGAIKEVGEYLEKCQFSKATERFIELAKFGNKYFDDKKPWKTVENDTETTNQTLYDCVQLISTLATLSHPFIPSTSAKITELINIKPTNSWTFNEVKAVHIKNKPQVLFKKIETKHEDKETKDYSEFNIEIEDSLQNDIPIEWAILKNLRIKRNSAKVEKWIKQKEIELIKKYHDENISNIPKLKAYRDQNDKFSKIKNLPAASEKLINMLLEQGKIPNINTFVDVYNIFSIESGITFGAHDMEKISGNVLIEKLKQDEEFIEMGTQKESTATTGEYVYKDSKGIICRLTIKQCDRTKITPDTKDVLTVLQGNSEIDKNILKQEIKKFQNTITNLLS